METYSNLGGDSGITHYQIGSDYIKVKFSKGTHTLYTYTNLSAGSAAISTMKDLARQGHGLNSYISTNKPGYASRA